MKTEIIKCIYITSWQAPAPRLYTIKWNYVGQKFELIHCTLAEVLQKLQAFEEENEYLTTPQVTNIEVIGEF